MRIDPVKPLAAPRRGEVWRVEFEPARGAEIRKVRPALVVSRDDVGRLPLRVVVPLTAWQDTFKTWPWMVKIKASAESGLTKDSAADTFQARSFSTERFTARLGKLTPSEVESVALAVASVVGVEVKDAV
jgi:mRNA interferase MazF